MGDRLSTNLPGSEQAFLFPPMEGERIRFLVGPLAGQTARVLGSNPENDAQVHVCTCIA